MYNEVRKISVSEIRYSIKEELKLLDTTEEDDTIDRWIKSGLRELNCLSTIITENEVLDICDGKAELPCDIIELLTMQPIAYTQSILNENEKKYHDFIYVSQQYFDDCKTNNTRKFEDNFSIDGRYILFPSNTTIAQIKVCYTAVNEDENELPIIYEKYELALLNYACYRYARREGINPQDYYAQWIAKKRFLTNEEQRKLFKLQREEYRRVISAIIIGRKIHY